MKVKDLLVKLMRLDDEDLERGVYFTYNYGDYGRTMVAQPVKHVDGEAQVEYSEYHRMHKLSTMESDMPDDKVKTVVVLS